MRPAILALCAALLAWLWLRGHKHPASSDPAWDEPEDGVQPADPVTVRGVWGLPTTTIRPGYGTGDWWPQPRTWTASDDRPPRHPDPDPTYLEAQRAAVRRATQSGPVGPSA